MPFTLLAARLLGIVLILLLASTALNAPGLAGLSAIGLVTLALLALPVFLAEALGLLGRAATFFFGRRG